MESHPLLKVERAHAINDIESYLQKLRSPAVNLDLMVPTEITHSHLGATGSLIQLLATWAKRCPKGRLLLYTNEPSKIDATLQNLIRTQHGLVALLTARAVMTNHTDVDCTVQARIAGLGALREMFKTELGFRNGSELLLLSADDTMYDAPDQLYAQPINSHPEIKPYADILRLASKMIASLSATYRRSVAPNEALTEQLATLVYELFKNTHMWARHSLDNVPIARSVRGIRLELSRYEDLDVKSLSPYQERYLNSISPKEAPQDFLELAVFDSGPGLAARMLRRSVSSQDPLASEYDAVMRCLSLHVTTSTKSHHGAGLVEVMRALSDANGFIRVRSGRLALFRDFSLDEKPFNNDFHLNDWSGGGRALHDHGDAEGTLVSILLPMPTWQFS